jgi:hypothetical protein
MPYQTMNALREAEEDAVTRHSVRYARAGQNHDVEGSQSGDGHGCRQPSSPARADNRLYDIRRDVL